MRELRIGPFGIQKRLKSVGRFRQILVVLGKYGFGEFFARTRLPLHLRAILTKPVGARPAGPEGLRMALEELGPTFIKFGQALSTRSYLLPAEYAFELAKLQDEVRPFPFDEVEATITADLCRSPADLFAAFDREPFASASIAQVHMAVLPSGEHVCVKVQRPAVRETLELDILILRDLARLLETYVPEARQYDPVGIVKEFERVSRREVDFTLEASVMTVFARNFADDPTVHIPRVYKQYCSSRVLTTEFVDGIKISDTEKLKAAGLDTAQIARIGARAVLKQVFEHGLFHADPHPGNIFVTGDGAIAPVDFGIVGRLTRDEVTDLAELMIGMVEGDDQTLLAVMEKLDMLPDDVRRRDVVEEIMLLAEKYGNRNLGELNFKEIFTELVSFMRRYRIKMRTEFLLLGKALGIYEEVGRVLDPDFSMMEEARPFVAKLARRRHVLSALLGRRGRAVADAVSRLSSMPSDLARVISMAREGKLKIEFEHVGLEKLVNEIERATNRLAFSLLVAALIVAASLVLVLGRGIAIYRAFGIASFAVAAIVGIWLLISILRSGRV